jgi:cobalt-zinc-cadmium efflux system outer membrane protein
VGAPELQRVAASLLLAGLVVGSGSGAVAAEGAPALPPARVLTIDEAIRAALEHNLALLARRHDVAMADAELLTAGLRPNPELEFSGEFLETRLARTGETEVAVGLSYEIEGFGKRPRRVEAARLARSAAEFAFRDQVRALVYEVQSAAVDVLLAKATLALARENLAGFEKIVEISEARRRAGDIAGAEVTRSHLALRQARNEVRQQEVALANAREALRLLVGATGAPGSVDVEDEFRSVAELPDPTRVREAALERRPDFLGVQAEEERASAELALQRAQRLPSVTLTTELRQVRGEAEFLGLFASVPLPLLDRNQGEIARARSEQLRAGAARRALQASIEHEVATSYAELAWAHELFGSIDRELLEDARRLRSIAEFAYRRGEASLLELLDANLVFNETMEAHYEARAAVARNLYRLEFLSAAAMEAP